MSLVALACRPAISAIPCRIPLGETQARRPAGQEADGAQRRPCQSPAMSPAQALRLEVKPTKWGCCSPTGGRRVRWTRCRPRGSMAPRQSQAASAPPSSLGETRSSARTVSRRALQASSSAIRDTNRRLQTSPCLLEAFHSGPMPAPSFGILSSHPAHLEDSLPLPPLALPCCALKSIIQRTGAPPARRAVDCAAGLRPSSSSSSTDARVRQLNIHYNTTPRFLHPPPPPPPIRSFTHLPPSDHH